MAEALGAVADVIGEDRDFSRRRQAVIAANAELQERELIKLAGWSAALADGLVRRGVDEPTASLAAHTGTAAFRVAFERWLADPGDRSLADTLRDSFDQLSAVIAGVDAHRVRRARPSLYPRTVDTVSAGVVWWYAKAENGGSG